jgi:hypothetical protein
MNYTYELTRRNLIEAKSKKGDEENIDEKDEKEDSEERHSSQNESGEKK